MSDKNVKEDRMSMISNKLDFSKEDLVPEQVLNEILWKYAKGANSPLPAPVRAAFFKQAAGGDKD